mmetsp:Transcript_108803/g.234288  ORF Transcript_108803/g.234288 Transcript_108803/m.234288 type:complete len:193 (+) Transcript_108803:1230-1808(+)
MVTQTIKKMNERKKDGVQNQFSSMVAKKDDEVIMNNLLTVNPIDDRDVEIEKIDKECVSKHECMDVLIIDDEVAVLSITSRIFSKMNLVVAHVVDGNELNDVLEWMIQCSFCRAKRILFLVDYELRSELGTALLVVYKDKIEKLNLGIYGLTSTEDKDIVNKYKQCGANDVLYKPLKAKDIQNIMGSYDKLI